MSETQNATIKSYYSGISHGLAALQASMMVQLLHPFDVVKTRFQSHR